MRSKRRSRSGRRRKRLDGMRKGIYILPNLVTTASLSAGFFSIVATMHEDFILAAWAILVATACDVADGRIARLTRSVSRFGIEYDSLADLVSFGVAPGILIYTWALQPFGRWGWSAAFLYVICGALRLARYNVQYGADEGKFFQGLPIPVSAGFIATLILLLVDLEQIGPIRHIIILLAIFVLAFLMVSNVKYPSFKTMDLIRRKPFPFLVGTVLVFIVIVAEPKFMLFFLCSLFILSGPLRLVTIRGQRAREVNGEEPDAPTPAGLEPSEENP